MQTANIPIPQFDQMGFGLPIPKDGLPTIPQILGTKSQLMSENEMMLQVASQHNMDSSTLKPLVGAKPFALLNNPKANVSYGAAAAVGLDVAPIPNDVSAPPVVNQLKESTEFGNKAYQGASVAQQLLPPTDEILPVSKAPTGGVSITQLASSDTDSIDTDMNKAEGLSVGLIVLFSLVGLLMVTGLSFGTYKMVQVVAQAWEVKKRGSVTGGRGSGDHYFTRWEVQSDVGGGDVDSLLDGNASAIYSDFGV